MIRKYHNHKLQTTPRHREEEPLNHPTRHQEDKLSKLWSLTQILLFEATKYD